jgi:hypothetical protein
MLKFNNLLISSILLFVFINIYYSLTSHLYKEKILEIQNKEWRGLDFNYKSFGALISFLLAILGLNIFVINNNLPLSYAFLYGIILNGFLNGVCYSTFEVWSGVGAILDTFFISLILTITTFLTYKIT